MEPLVTIFLLGVFGVVAGFAAAARLVVGLVDAYWFPLAFAVAFCVMVTLLAGVLSRVSRRRDLKQRLRERRSRPVVQTMQIKVEADTSEATAAIEQLEQRVKACAAQVEALNRLAIHNVMAEV